MSSTPPSLSPCPDCRAMIDLAGAYCPKCGLPLHADPAKLARPASRPPLQRLALSVVLSLAVVISIFAVSVHNSATNSQSTGPSPSFSSVPSAPLPMPAAESALIAAVAQARGGYNDGMNELQKSAVRTRRVDLIRSALGDSLDVLNWSGTLDSMNTNGEGKAVLSIKIDENINISTWNNALSDIASNTLIPQTSRLYQVASTMSPGQRVYFSGSFIASPKDFILEKSVTERGSMNSPDFLFRFSSIGLDPEPPAPSLQVEIPSSQSAFLRALAASADEYKAQPNALKASAVRTRRSAAIRDALARSYDVSGWTGTLKSMGTTGDGHAFINVQLPGSDASVATFNNAFSDANTATLIPHASPLYKTISEMQPGQPLTFSGSFLPGHPDIILESSLTEAGSMDAPAFIFRFSSVKPLP
jgi:hypothetical protein